MQYIYIYIYIYIYNTTQHNTAQHNTTQYNTIQYNTIQYKIIQYNTTIYPHFHFLHIFTMFHIFRKQKRKLDSCKKMLKYKLHTGKCLASK